MLKSVSLISLLSFLLIYPVFSQDDSIDVYNYNLIELSNMRVSSVSKVPQEVAKVPSSIHIISSKEIKENGYFTLDEALSNLPGFQFRNIMGFNSYVFQRGIPSQNNLILVLIDGIQVNELNSGGFYAGGQYNLENIERIEVVYGPASVVYGTNAISGIINIITKNDVGISASVLGGNFNTYNANLNFGYQKNDFGLRLSGNYKTTKKADLKGEAGDNNWTEQMENFEHDYSFDAKVRYKNFTVGANFLNKQASMATFYPSVGTIYQDHGTLWNIMFINAYLKHQHKFSDKLCLSSKIYNRNATVLDNTITRIVDTAQVGFFRPNYLLGFESVVDYYYKKKLRLTVGLSAEYEEIAEGFSVTLSNSNTEIPAPPPKPNMLQNNLLSLFLESEYEIVQKLLLIGGLRFDNSSVYNQVLTPRISLLYSGKNMVSKLLYAEAFRAPKPWDYTDGIGNTGLEPEKMKSIELSNSFYFNENFLIGISLYKNSLDRAFVKNVLGDGDNFQWINKGTIETDGVEFSTKYASRKLSLYANYTFNNSYDENKKEVAEIAKHTANAGIEYHLFDFLAINLRTNYLGKRKNPQTITATNSNYIDYALVFNGSITYTPFKNLDIQLCINNIFDEVYYHTSNRLVERYRQAQRRVLVKLNYNFTKL
jgi:outer membrane receptor for ferrienterochelin and colicins